MARGSGRKKLHGFLAASLLLAAWGCSSAGTGGGEVGSPGTVAQGPWMDEVAIGPGIDIGNEYVTLACAAERPKISAQEDPNEADVGEEDAPSLQPTVPNVTKPDTIDLTLTFVGGNNRNRVTRVIDKTKNEFRQPMVDSDGRITIPWKNQDSQNVEVFMTSFSAMEASSETQACSAAGCVEAGMQSVRVCLQADESCKAFGFSAMPVCQNTGKLNLPKDFHNEPL